ncbi:MAG: NAD(P)-dependent oxidoreductase, partial [Egibacteraceae bacterium]
PSAMTAGVVGYGRIGRSAAQLLGRLGFRVIAHDAHAPIGEGDVTSAALDEVLAASDVVTLHAPGQPDGHPLLDAGRLSLLKPGSVLVNTARGSHIDERALAQSMRQGRPGMAALDVFATEPPDLSAFAGVGERLILTPHMAWYTEESQADLRYKAAAEAARLLRGERPRDLVVEPEVQSR